MSQQALYSLYPTLLQPFLEVISPHLTQLAKGEEALNSRLYNEYGLHILKVSAPRASCLTV